MFGSGMTALAVIISIIAVAIPTCGDLASKDYVDKAIQYKDKEVLQVIKRIDRFELQINGRLDKLSDKLDK